MSDSGSDVFTRLSLVIEDWSAQVAQSHEQLSAQIECAREHLDRLLATSTDLEREALDDHPRDTIARLEAEVAELRADLESARAAAILPVSADNPGTAFERVHVAELEEALDLAREALAERTASMRLLEMQLREAAEENASLEAELRAARTASAASDEADEIVALRGALDMLQLEHTAAQDEMRALRQQLAGGEHVRAGTPASIDAFDARGHKKRMGEILVEMGVLSEVQLRQMLKAQAADPQRRLGALVVEHGYTGEDLVARILAAQLRLPYQDLQEFQPDPAAVALVSPHVIHLHRCMPLVENDGVLTVAMVNPLDLIAIEDIELASRCRVAPAVSTQSQIDALIAAHYPPPR